MDWKFEYNVVEKLHYCGFQAWKEYQQEMEILQVNIKKPLELLLPIIFVDDYLRDKSTKSMSTGIYMTLANFPIRYCSVDYKMLKFVLQTII